MVRVLGWDADWKVLVDLWNVGNPKDWGEGGGVKVVGHGIFEARVASDDNHNISISK